MTTDIGTADSLAVKGCIYIYAPKVKHSNMHHSRPIPTAAAATSAPTATFRL
jgi:hypothetical protein